MDFVDVVDVVSAALRQLKTEPYGESYISRKAIIKVEASIEDLVRIKNFLVYDHDELKEMLEKLVALIYKIEDFAETQFLRRMHVRSVGFGGRYIFVLRQMLNLKAKVDFRSEMRKIELEVDGVIKESGVIKERHPREQSDVVGFEEDKRQLVGWLTNTNSSPDLGFLLISGQTGSGKTTFATEIYKSPELKRHFKFRAWVSASEDPVSNLRSILQQLEGDSTVYMKSNEAELKEKISEILQKKRCLLVVDNNVTNPYELFEIIPDSALSDEGNGSRVIMTIFRYTFLIDYFMYEYRSRLHYELKPLKEEDAWQLFLKKVLFPDNVQSKQSPDLDYNKLKSKIIAISQGIPSAIVLLGRFLSTKKSYKECLAVLDRNPIERNELVSVSKMLALMNSDLTSRLRPCLLYFGLFPKGFEIPVRRLLRLWLAEGLIVNDGPDPDTEENPAWVSLKMKGMIEIAKTRKDGSPKTCRMPGILHDICFSKAEDIFGLLHIHPTTPDPKSSSDNASPSPSPKFGVRRVSGDIKNYSRKDSHMRQLRSYLSFKFDTQNKDTPALEIDYFLSAEVIGHRGFGMLKVLDLERVYKPELPQNLGHLYQLRYLGLRWTFLDTLPHSVSELRYLQTLDVKHTSISSPPNSIWKMQHLRHLCLNETRLDKPVRKHGISLPELQTLWGIFVDKNIPVKHGLDKTTNLTKLGLTSHEDSVEELYGWIIKLKQLKFLRLRSKNYYGQASKLELKSLSCLENLSNLYLHGKLPKLDHQFFPERLERLTLSVSNLKEDPMPILAKLQILVDLRLLADSYAGKKMVCPNDGFFCLRSLKLWMLKELETWIVEEGALQDLKELEIRCCHKLNKLPDGLDLEGIDKIILTNMEEGFVANVVQDKIPKGKSNILETQNLKVRCHCQDDVKQG